MQPTCEAPSSSSSPWGCRITNSTLACAFDNLVSPALLPSIETEVAAFEPPSHGATAWYGLGTLPRTTVEELIANVIAPVALGSDLMQFAGADWWVQPRTAENAKSYHSDTDTQNCHATGEKECHGADVSTVFYLDSAGGPTIMFNQSFGPNGLKPRIPNQLGLCEPRVGRLLVFRGDLYHGVLKRPGSARRLTLLVNLWRSKPDQALAWTPPETPRKQHRHVGPPVAHRPVPLTPVSISTTFDKGFEDWQAQKLPKHIEKAIERVNGGGSGSGVSSGGGSSGKRSKRGKRKGSGSSGDADGSSDDGSGDGGDGSADGSASKAAPQSTPPPPPPPGLYWVSFEPSSVNTQFPDSQRIPSWALWK